MTRQEGEPYSVSTQVLTPSEVLTYTTAQKLTASKIYRATIEQSQCQYLGVSCPWRPGENGWKQGEEVQSATRNNTVRKNGTNLQGGKGQYKHIHAHILCVCVWYVLQRWGWGGGVEKHKLINWCWVYKFHSDFLTVQWVSVQNVYNTAANLKPSFSFRDIFNAMCGLGLPSVTFFYMSSDGNMDKTVRHTEI